ncbi:MAG: PRC-barrel domain-containing protein [Ardenticatenaceae bacterium]|nr:PRC-barrel domain-containing protein [Anaerolineales bacterium]MCB8920179.1 PRC-barrel domain-containing protein [Ardenticatenaceae bacterium]
MDIPLNVSVFGPNGRIGQSTFVIMNPITQEVTHIVVKSESVLQTEHLVALKHIQSSDSDMIRLDCTGEQLAQMDLFQEVEFDSVNIPNFGAPAAIGDAYIWPYVTASPEARLVKIVHRHIPPYEREIRRGAHVHAANGRIGQVDELVVDKDTFHVTHLVLREGHLWGTKDVMIPVDEIETVTEDNIYLKLDKKSIGALPTFPVHRHIQH